MTNTNIGEHTSYTGTIHVEGLPDMSVAVMKDGTRLLALRDLYKAMNITGDLCRQPRTDDHPIYLQELEPLVSHRLFSLLEPRHTRRYTTGWSGRGLKSVNAQALPTLASETARLKHEGILPVMLDGMNEPADTIVRTFDPTPQETVNRRLAMMIDKATGYEDRRRSDTIERMIRDAYGDQPITSWLTEMPIEWWRQLARIRGWNWNMLGISNMNTPRKLDTVIRRTLLELLPPDLAHTVLTTPVCRADDEQLDMFNTQAQRQIGIMSCYTSWNGFQQRAAEQRNLI
jgi:hypothetical protein